ncbi:class I SAM-dependent methyltransferase [candidate division WS5 bacterium]|uniref:Class I SAM-dependent methyltransferase n=1 Tax=candidate division WS5 bacterium TaxID=2093353 RepID=A0A419DD87_9BACT|nr:MAG: class I SAM-dependent methyltransferase [candidate division WS5 bacterium]
MNLHSAKLYDRIIDAYKNYGLISTLKVSFISVMDYYFDFKYGTDTVRHVELRSLEINSENLSRGHRYALTPEKAFIKLMAKIKFPVNSVFVDLGCGKGKILLLASQFGFSRVVGIEFSKSLCECARNNISVYGAKKTLNSTLEVVHSDVVDYEIKDDENVFYLFNPFDDTVLSNVLGNIIKSVEKAPRKVYLIYYIPYHGNIIEQCGNFKRLDRYFFSGCEFVLYVNDK